MKAKAFWLVIALACVVSLGCGGRSGGAKPGDLQKAKDELGPNPKLTLDAEGKDATPDNVQPGSTPPSNP